jgi:predicted transcriptional regulator
MIESASKGGVTKTKIMYMAFVPHEQMAEFLALLTENDLITFDRRTHLYSTTPKGMQFLNAYNNLHDCLSSMPLI